MLLIIGLQGHLRQTGPFSSFACDILEPWSGVLCKRLESKHDAPYRVQGMINDNGDVLARLFLDPNVVKVWMVFGTSYSFVLIDHSKLLLFWRNLRNIWNLRV